MYDKSSEAASGFDEKVDDCMEEIQPIRVPYRPAYESVAESMTEMISAASLQAGDRLPTEQEWCQRLGVSRTVVREAIKVLVTRGQVQTRKGSGLYVTTPPAAFKSAMIDVSMSVDPSQVISLFEFRQGLEMQSVRLATERVTHRQMLLLQEAVVRHREAAERGDYHVFDEADTGFHLGIAEASGNPFLTSALKTVTQLLDWALAIATGMSPGSLMIASEQHMLILAALQDGTPDAAAHAMKTHLDWVVECYQHEVRRRLLNPET